LSLADWLAGRDNNFNLLRLTAASMVIYAHSHPFVQGFIDGREPDWRGDALYALTGLDSGRIAVEVFRILSGFLVSQSLTHRASLVDFYRARALRVQPALWVAVLFCAFVIGPAFTTLPLHDYFRDGELRHFLAFNLTLRNDPSQHLPGLFAQNPYARVVNGSLWTLPWEVLMYVALATFGALGLLARRSFMLVATVAAYATFRVLVDAFSYSDWRVVYPLSFGSFFFFGTLLWLYRDRVRMDGTLLAAAFVALLVAMGTMPQHEAGRVLYVPLLAYVVIGLALVPGGFIRAYNRVGDYSYGIYIYGFAVQQTLIALFPKLGTYALTIASLLAVLIFAAPSWHLLEKRALALKNRARLREPLQPERVQA